MTETFNEDKLWSLAFELADRLHQTWASNGGYGSYTRFWQCDVPALLVEFAKQADREAQAGAGREVRELFRIATEEGWSAFAARFRVDNS